MVTGVDRPGGHGDHRVMATQVEEKLSVDGVDPFLRAWVKVGAQLPEPTGLTLVVGGTVFSGKLVSAAVLYEGWEDLVQGGKLDVITQMASKARDAANDPTHAPDFVHLKNPTMMHGNTRSILNNITIRIPLARVDGWHVGSIASVVG